MARIRAARKRKTVRAKPVSGREEHLFCGVLQVTVGDAARDVPAFVHANSARTARTAMFEQIRNQHACEYLQRKLAAERDRDDVPAEVAIDDIKLLQRVRLNGERQYAYKSIISTLDNTGAMAEAFCAILDAGIRFGTYLERRRVRNKKRRVKK
jgi:hypothetical protein